MKIVMKSRLVSYVKTKCSERTCSFGEIVKHVGDSAAKGQHDHEEGYQEHANILNINKNVT